MGRPGGELPNYGARLRRARLGLICGIATVSMVFISLTSAYVVRRGLPTFDGTIEHLCARLGRVQLPWMLLAINTAVLLVSTVTMEFARRHKRRAALAPVKSIPGVSMGDERSFPWLGMTVVLGFGISGRAMAGLGRTEGSRIFCQYESEQFFVYLLTAAHAVHLAGGIVALMWAGVLPCCTSRWRGGGLWWMLRHGIGISCRCCGFTFLRCWGSRDKGSEQDLTLHASCIGPSGQRPPLRMKDVRKGNLGNG